MLTQTRLRTGTVCQRAALRKQSGCLISLLSVARQPPARSSLPVHHRHRHHRCHCPSSPHLPTDSPTHSPTSSDSPAATLTQAHHPLYHQPHPAVSPVAAAAAGHASFHSQIGGQHHVHHHHPALHQQDQGHEGHGHQTQHPALGLHYPLTGGYSAAAGLTGPLPGHLFSHHSAGDSYSPHILFQSGGMRSPDAAIQQIHSNGESDDGDQKFASPLSQWMSVSADVRLCVVRWLRAQCQSGGNPAAVSGVADN